MDQEEVLTVKIPQDVEEGMALRISGKGLPEFGNGRYGDMYLRIEVWVPEWLSREERELYERLYSIGSKPH